MPWSVEDVDKHNKGLSPSQKKQWVAVANDALKRCEAKGGKDCEKHAIMQANGAVRRSDVVEFSLAIRKAYFDEKTQEMRWKADASDIDEDSFKDEMSLELYNDFIHRIETNEKPPETYCSEFWSGGMPYLSVAHYKDQNGDGVPGMPDALYVDGKVLKAKGKYYDTPIGRACFKSVLQSLNGETDKPVRVSIAFLDYKHQHKSTGTIYERKSADDICEECIQDMVSHITKGTELGGLRYLSGHLIHLAHTRVPVNKRTLMEVDKSMTTQKEDAESIIGEELAEELEAKERALIGKSEALVIKAEDGKCPKCGKKMEEGKDHVCDKEEKKAEYDFALLEGKVDKMLSLLETPKPEPIPHALDSAFSQFKRDFDSVMLSDTSADEKLVTLQASINAVGEAVISVVKSQAKPVSKEKMESDALTQLSDVVTSLAQEVKLISTRLESVPVRAVEAPTNAQPVIPQRRSLSLSPALVAKKSESITPKLHDLIQKSVQ